MKYIRYNTGLFLDWLKNARKASYGADQEGQRFTDPGPVILAGAALRMSCEKPYFTSPTYLHQQERADWQQVQPEMRRFSAQFIERLRLRSLPFYAHSAFRTQSEQRALYDKGVSKTKYPYAAHCQGAAVDIVHSRYHWLLDKTEWDYVGKVGKDLAHNLGIDITWGGDWKFYDPAHWELTGWKDRVNPHIQSGLPIRKTAKRLLRENPNP
ncbi:MAG: hypothetical protein [Microviridae sp.]|nr:MAG: hypothetical protein [Microviridae sp.]